LNGKGRPGIREKPLKKTIARPYLFQYKQNNRINLKSLKYQKMGKMAEGSGKDSYIEPTCSSMGCCRIESLISVDGRGQMVIPKEMREGQELAPEIGLAC